MKKDPKIFIEHILESIESIENYTKGQTKESFSKAKMMQDAVIRKIEKANHGTLRELRMTRPSRSAFNPIAT